MHPERDTPTIQIAELSGRHHDQSKPYTTHTGESLLDDTTRILKVERIAFVGNERRPFLEKSGL